jgi:hypothetical protein
MSIVRAIENAFKTKVDRGWDRIYVAVDLHGTVLEPDYHSDGISTKFYPYAAETLLEFSKRSDVKLIMYTCSYPEEIGEYLTFFRSHDIIFDYINCNPEVKTGDSKHGYFEDKFYCNLLLDDKALFNPLEDWKPLLESLNML